MISTTIWMCMCLLAVVIGLLLGRLLRDTKDSVKEYNAIQKWIKHTRTIEAIKKTDTIPVYDVVVQADVHDEGNWVTVVQGGLEIVCNQRPTYNN